MADRVVKQVSVVLNALLAIGSVFLLLGIITPKDSRGLSFEYDDSSAEVSVDPTSLECLALNIYHEARGESTVGKQAVAQVVMNRVMDSQFPDTVCGVIEEGGEVLNQCQFSWRCDGKSDLPDEEPAAWAESKRLAQQILAGNGPQDLTGNALYYHSTTASPKWARNFLHTIKIGRHKFYRPA